MIWSRKKKLLLVFLFGAFMGLFFPTWQSLIKFWYTSEDYSHGFFIVPISLYFAWQKKMIMTTSQVKPSYWGLYLILFALISYLLALFAEINTLASVSMLLTINGIIIFLFGFKVLNQMIFPMALLLFMIPVPSQVYSTVTMPLQLLVSKASAEAAMMMGIPVYREGNVITLPGRTLEVVQACSGLRSLNTLLMLGAIFAHITLQSNWTRALLFISGIPFAIAANIVRVFGIVVAFYYLQYDLTSGKLHTVYGLSVFFFALCLVALTQKVIAFWDKSATKK